MKPLNSRLIYFAIFCLMNIFMVKVSTATLKSLDGTLFHYKALLSCSSRLLLPTSFLSCFTTDKIRSKSAWAPSIPPGLERVNTEKNFTLRSFLRELFYKALKFIALFVSECDFLHVNFIATSILPSWLILHLRYIFRLSLLC